MPVRLTHLRIAIAAVSILIVTLAVVAQKPTPTPERSREIVALLSDARLAAPELAVDTFLKVVESKKVTDPVWRKEIIDEALRMIDDVKYPVRKQVVWFPRTPIDTVAGYMSYAYDQKLDGLSLKSRVIKLLVNGNKDRAKQLVFEIGGDLKLKPLRCEETMAYEVADIYSAAGMVANSIFPPKEIAEGVRALYVLPWIENMESPAQIGPAITLIRELQGSPAEKQMLFNAFGRKINRNFNDDRSFSHALAHDRVAWNFATLNSAMAISEKIDMRPLFRDFLVKNLTAARCEENKPAKKEELPSIAEDANFLYRDDGKPFVPEDFESVEYKGKATIVNYLDSKISHKLDRKFRPAREAKNEAIKAGDKTAEITWELKVNEILGDIEAWKASDEETDAEVFNQKCVLFGAMSEAIADGPLKKSELRSYLRYLDKTPMQKDSFIEWLYYLRRFVDKNSVIFNELAPEFPNPNFRVIVATKKLGL